MKRQIPTEISGPPPEVIPNIPVRRNRNGLFHLNSNRNFRNLCHNGKHLQISSYRSSPFSGLLRLDNMRTVKFKTHPTNAFFASANHMFNGSSQLPTAAACRALCRCLNCAQRFGYCALGTRRKLRGAACRLSFEFYRLCTATPPLKNIGKELLPDFFEGRRAMKLRVRMLLKAGCSTFLFVSTRKRVTHTGLKWRGGGERTEIAPVHTISVGCHARKKKTRHLPRSFRK